MTTATVSVEYVNPASLLVDHNIRTTSGLDKTFLTSIRDLGVLVPIVAVRTSEDALRVRYGHRRTLAAVGVGRDTVPVVVTSDDDADEVARIVTQWHENEYRAGLTTADKLAAVEQLALLGLNAAQIVKRTRAPKAEVEHALAATGSPLAKGAADRYAFLTLDQAAAVAEFDSAPEVAKALVSAAKDSPVAFCHVLQRARDDREEAAQVTAITQELTGNGVRVIDPPGYDDRSVKALSDLTDTGGQRITAEAHAACPGHAAYVRTGWRTEAVYVCTAWVAEGHRDRYSDRRPGSAPMDETAKAQRREVIANNKAWKAATTVRRDWLATFLARKTAPKGTTVYVAGELIRASHALRRAMERNPDLLGTLLGVDTSKGRGGVTSVADAATDSRAQVIALGVVLAAIEDSTDTHTWRAPADVYARYFGFLVANGYALADVEQIAAGTAKKPSRSRQPRGNQQVDTPATSTEPSGNDSADAVA